MAPVFQFVTRGDTKAGEIRGVKEEREREREREKGEGKGENSDIGWWDKDIPDGANAERD
jgi:hypothetical protein